MVLPESFPKSVGAEADVPGGFPVGISDFCFNDPFSNGSPAGEVVGAGPCWS
jgi:hypothetical protein